MAATFRVRAVRVYNKLPRSAIGPSNGRVGLKLKKSPGVGIGPQHDASLEGSGEDIYRL